MGPLNALIFHLHLPSELSLTSQDAYLTPPPLSQTLQTPSHSDSVNDSASFLWEKVKHSEKIIFVEKLELTVLISFHVGIY